MKRIAPGNVKPDKDNSNYISGSQYRAMQKADLAEVDGFREVYTVHDAFRELQDKLKHDGYKFVPDPGNELAIAGCSIYRRRYPGHAAFSYIDHAGVSPLTKLENDNNALEHFTSQNLKDAYSAMMIDAKDHEEKHKIRALEELRKNLIDDPFNVRSSLYSVNSKLGGINRKAKTYEQIAFNGEGDRIRWIPRKDQFPKYLQEIDPIEWAKFGFPEAEAEALMLMLGKALRGNDKQDRVVNGDVTLGAKCIMLMWGEPSTGKSAFCDLLRETMNLLGFHTSTIQEDMAARFGGDLWGSFAAFKDDSTAKQVQDILEGKAASVFKSAASGAVMKVERKGVDAHSIHARALPIIMANDIRDASILFADSGSLERFFPLLTKTLAEMGDSVNRKEADMRWFWYEHLPRQFEEVVPPEVLMMYFLRGCVDRMVEAAGYSLERGCWKRTKPENSFHKKLKNLRESFATLTHYNHKKELIKASEMLALYTLWENQHKFKKLVFDKKKMNMGLPTSLLLGVIQVQIGDYQIPEFLHLSNLNTDSIGAMRAKALQLKDVMLKAEPGKAFEQLTKQMKTEQDIGYPTSGRHLAGWAKGLINWQDRIKNLDATTERLFEQMSLNSTGISSATETVEKYFKEMLRKQHRILA